MDIKNTILVGAFGGPGAGKTTSAWEIAAELKKLGLVVEYVSEYAKELVWEDNRELLNGSYNNQMQVYKEQKKRIDRLIGKVDVIVTDSPTVLSVNYLDREKVSTAQIKQFSEMAVGDYKQYKTFNFFIERGQGAYEQEGRLQTLEQSKKIDEEIKHFLKSNQIKFGIYKRSSLHTITSNINWYCKKQQEFKTRTIIKQNNTVPHYDLKKLKELPIREVAEIYGIEVVKKGGSLWCKLRDETAASCKIYETTNTFCDFGDSNLGGDTIDFVAQIKNIDVVTAMQDLAAAFQIEPENPLTQDSNYVLSFKQYEKIGIAGELATMNFDFDIDKYGVEKTQAFSEKYRMSVNELKKQYPTVYENMLKSKALPFVYSQRQQYYHSLWNNDLIYRDMGKDYAKSPDLNGEMRLAALERNEENKILMLAVRDTNITYRQVVCDAEKDIEKIRNGKIQFEVGNTLYADIKRQNSALSYKEVSADTYLKKTGELKEIGYAAFVKGDKVNIAVKSDDKLLLDRVFPEPQRQIKSVIK